MDPNLLFWKSEGQSFFSRFKIWVNILDPTSLLSSDATIKRAHGLLRGGQKLDDWDKEAVTLSLSSVHADSGDVLPLMLRPAAFLSTSAPLVIASFLPHTNVKYALLWQFFLQSYQTRFTLANRNSSSEKSKKLSSRQLLLSAGTVCYATCAGSLPQIMIYKLGVSSEVIKAVLRTMLPIPLSAAVAFISVYTVRSEESQTGIKVFDSNGNLVGLSKAAGQKAVKETALSRAALFGTTAAVPSLLITLLWRTRVIQKSSVLIAPLRYMSVAIGFGLMIPVSFSLFPQLGTIKKENVEKNLQETACDGLLYYHRGL
ncbi:sideroflexin-4 [Pseudochaenichthys georgianus]|uniref:sideroflexin-4 n=1 Tax=Pseudochaenichthys georgianus TaxID=52239 RepID=UPI00146EA3A7|nr:sideroflexin-4 [Pseudochaenichthys georgianus]